MTSLTFVIGMVPLVIACGAGAASRQAVGTGRDGQHADRHLPFGIFFTPLFYWRRTSADAEGPKSAGPRPLARRLPPTNPRRLACALPAPSGLALTRWAAAASAPPHEQPAAPIYSSYAEPAAPDGPAGQPRSAGRASSAIRC